MAQFSLLLCLCCLAMGTDSVVAESGCEEQNHAVIVLAMKVARMEEEIQEKDEIIEKRNEELKTAQQKLATLETHSISGEWGSWSNWSSCNRTCGGGVRERRRECNEPAPECGGSSCTGEEGVGENEIHFTHTTNTNQSVVTNVKVYLFGRTEMHH